jgi:hypothetical protein
VAQQREDLVLVHTEAEVVDGHLLSEGLAELVHDHRRRTEERLVHLLRGNSVGCGACLQGGVSIASGHIVILHVALGAPVGRQDGEVPGLGHAHLRPPHLREVPGQQGVDEDVGEQDAADRADVNAVVGLQERAGADLQTHGRDQAANDLGRLVGDGGSVDGEHHDVDHEEA